MTLTLIEWLTERRDNCLRIARNKSGGDRLGWIEDALYFGAAIAAVEQLNALARPRQLDA